MGLARRHSKDEIEMLDVACYSCGYALTTEKPGISISDFARLCDDCSKELFENLRVVIRDTGREERDMEVSNDEETVKMITTGQPQAIRLPYVKEGAARAGPAKWPTPLSAETKKNAEIAIQNAEQWIVLQLGEYAAAMDGYGVDQVAKLVIQLRDIRAMKSSLYSG